MGNKMKFAYLFYSGVDDKSVNVTTTPTAHLKIYSSSNTDISGGGVVTLNDSIQMSITLDNEFSGMISATMHL